MKRFWIVLGILFIGLLFPSWTSAQTTSTLTGDDPGMVYAVFFYLPTCPHCHAVIENTFPAWESEFGDQLMIVPINASISGTETLFSAACRVYGVDRCGSVPLLLIGDRYLLGSVDIPDIGTPLIRQLIADGGSPLPDFYGIEDYFASYVQTLPVQPEVNNLSVDVTESTTDHGANLLAVFILIALVGSVFTVIYYGRRGQSVAPMLSRAALSLTLLTAIVVALTLVASPEGSALASITIWSVLALVSIVAMLEAITFADNTFSPIASQWAIPLITVAGLGVALYLAYIESTHTEAVCGTLGNCNTVQGSDYAYVLGIPIGVLGIVGYGGILLAWIGGQVLHYDFAEKALIVMILFGALFSTYLTFLEPFVIGATCAWCLMSALTMLMLLWLVLPQDVSTLTHLLRRSPAKQVA